MTNLLLLLAILASRFGYVGGRFIQGKGVGWQSLDQWTRLQDGLNEFGLIKQKVNPAVFFDDTIQNKIYRGGKLRWP